MIIASIRTTRGVVGTGGRLGLVEDESHEKSFRELAIRSGDGRVLKLGGVLTTQFRHLFRANSPGFEEFFGFGANLSAVTKSQRSG